MQTWAGNGHSDDQAGVSINLYAANRSMKNRYFYNADGEMLIVPQEGRLRLATELGLIDIEPCEIAVIPRGVRFRVELIDPSARGYMLENFGAALRLPELGPRSEEHTSELQSLMRISYAVFCLKKKMNKTVTLS